MNDRWNRSVELYHGALSRDPEQRAAFLHAMCPDDEPLRIEVERLLEYDAKAAGFLERPLIAVGCDNDTQAQPPSAIAHYKITGKLGEGGMGAVYRATDTKLNRDVAIKILPDALAGDREYLARFKREAQVLAALNHPHIAAVYGVEERAIVMELVEGRDLPTPVPMDEALVIGRQIAEALEAAHEKGIVHRDLKPANIKLKPDGTVKVLDFGLAKTAELAVANSEDSPTLTIRATEAGMIMGTAAYMAPEQAAGKPVDKRADIWAFGVVLYEMLAGARLFEGETVAHILANVLKGEIDFGKLPGATPPPVRTLLARCLNRDPRMRLRDIGEARVLLGEPLSAASPARRSRTLTVLASALVLTLAALAAVMLRAPARTEALLRQYSIASGEVTNNTNVASARISPDGRKVAYAAANRIWIRELDREDPRAVEGSEGGTGPFWSPDSVSVGFVAREHVMRATLAGGVPATVCTASRVRFCGGAWSPDGKTIAFSELGSGLMTVPSIGGEPHRVTPADSRPFYSPSFVPGPEGAGWVVASYGQYGQFAQDLVAVRLDTGELRPLGPGASPVVSTSGHLLFSRNTSDTGTGVAVATLSPRDWKLGPVVTLVPGGVFPSVSGDGTLLYLDLGSDRQLVYRDRTGKFLGNAGLPQPGVNTFSLSPDGRSVALSSTEQGSLDIWVQDLASNTKRRLTFDPLSESFPRWSPDGRSIVYRSSAGMTVSHADGSGSPTVIVPAPKPWIGLGPGDWSGEGRLLIYTTTGDTSGGKVYYLRLKPGGTWESAPFAVTPFDQNSPRLAPNHPFAAYLSTESGRIELYVRPFPEGPGKWRVSNDGATQPRWSRDGKELYYLEGDLLVAVPVSFQGGFSSGPPRSLFHVGSELTERNSLKYDVAPDGRFVVVEAANGPGARPSSIHMVENWPALLKSVQPGREQP